MSKSKDKVLKIVSVTGYALLRALFSFAKMSSLIFYSQLFSAVLWLEEKMDFHTDIWIRCRNNLIILAHKTLFKWAVYSAVKLVNKQTVKVICWYVYPSMVDVIRGPQITLTKRWGLCLIPLKPERLMIASANRIRSKWCELQG